MCKRFAVLALFAAGCGGGNMTADGGDAGVGDLAMRGDLAMAAGSTGAPCKSKADCSGSTPTCILTKDGLTWRDGYCSAGCSDGDNDTTTRFNPACPGGTSTCAGGQCFLGCSAGTCRDGYSCFNFAEIPVCWTTAASECDPTTMNTCPQDGGTTDDAGTYFGKVCVPLGDDPVGLCWNACDVFEQNCAQDEACTADEMTGQADCAGAGLGSDGEACKYLNDCAAGLACHDEGGNSVCRAYCGGPGNGACPMGQTCKDLSQMVPKSRIGICAP
jgi:hypothetical protein